MTSTGTTLHLLPDEIDLPTLILTAAGLGPWQARSSTAPSGRRARKALEGRSDSPWLLLPAPWHSPHSRPSYGRYPDAMFPKGVGIKARLIPFLVSMAFAALVTLVGNDVLAVYGGVVVFIAVYVVVVEYAERRGNVAWLD